MFLENLSKFYKKHTKFFTKTFDLLIPNKSLRGYISTVLSFQDGPTCFLNKSKQLKQAYNKNTKHLLSIVAIMKNEAPYLQEWIEYHRIIGVEKFYLYDNESNDNTYEILKPYINRGIVEYISFPGDKQQIPAYTHFINHYKQETHWVAVIDLDEFIVVKHGTIQKILNHYNNAAQIIVPWVFFGSNGHIKKPNGLVIENYTKRQKKPRLYKSIINPQLAIKMQCHDHIVAGKTVFPKMDKIMINHYYCKSLQEFQRRATRGDALNGKKFALATFDKSNFDKFDVNEVYDPFILQYVDTIKNNIKKGIKK